MEARLGGLGSVDAVGLHPYEDSLGQVFQSIREVRRTLDELGGSSVPLDITEIGWSTVRTPEAVRARRLALLARQLPQSGCKIEALIPHSWLTAEATRAQPEDWFGLANHDGSLKPSGRAYLRAAAPKQNPAKSGSRICGRSG
jgi:hypothetical protein